MIYLLILLDILLNNYTAFTTYFFIIFLYNKKYIYFLLTGLIFDLIIFNTPLINVLILSIIYYLNKVFKELNKNNFYNYIFINIFNYILYIFLSNLFTLNSIFNILVLIGSNLFINILFYILFFRLIKK